MEYLQYSQVFKNSNIIKSFKPCYKWNTFNTEIERVKRMMDSTGFKPCYKWNTFNTKEKWCEEHPNDSFKPCYKWNTFNTSFSQLLSYHLANSF